MAKLLKIAAKWIGGILEWLLIILISIAFAVRTSPVQTWLAGIATDFLSDELKTELRIGKVDIFFFDRVALDDVFVRDQKGDTLASLGSVEVVLRSLNLATNKMTLRNIALNDGRVGVSRDSLSGDYNYWFITDYFSSGSSSSGSKPMAVTVQSLNINHVNVTYDDYRKSYSEYGMDYDHLGFTDVVLDADEFSIVGKEYRFTLQSLSVREKCGINLKRFKTKARINDKGIYLTDVKINTSRSRIYAGHFYMKMKGLQCVHTFEDSVTFDAKIDSSRVNLADVAYFAPELKGMNQVVNLKAGLKQKVKNLRIKDIDLRTGSRTIVQGDLLLPDFRNPDNCYLDEQIQYALVDLKDLQQMRLPDEAAQRFVSFDPMIGRLGYFEARKLSLTGFWRQFVMSGKKIGTALGTVHIDNGLRFTELQEGGYAFERSTNSNYDVLVDSFQLGKFIDEPLFGKVNGALFLSGIVGQKDIIRIQKLDGEINRLGFNDYNYTNIRVHEGSFIDNVFEAGISIDDPHLKLTYDGKVDLNGGYRYQFSVNDLEADLGMLRFTEASDTRMETGFVVDMYGRDLKTYAGTVNFTRLDYRENGKNIATGALGFNLTRGTDDQITLNSSVADVTLRGKIDPDRITTSLNNMLSHILSAFFQYQPLPRKTTDNNHFDLMVNVRQPDEVLAIFAPDLSISSGTQFSMLYNAALGESEISLNSGKIVYNGMVVENLKLGQSLTEDTLIASVASSMVFFNDSLYGNHIDVQITGDDNRFLTVAGWNEGERNPARFTWLTQFGENGRINLQLKPSFFTVKGQMWEIMNSSDLVYSDGILAIDHFMMEREEQFVGINGILSDSPEDGVNIEVNHLHLDEISSFVHPAAELEGNVGGSLTIRTPFTTFRAEGKLHTEGLVINGEPIGDVSVSGNWDDQNERMNLEGDLRYLRSETFDFYGYYYPYKPHENIDFKLDFNGMDLQFANAFIDPEIVRDIKGRVRGEIALTGDVTSPRIDGKLKLENGGLRVDMLGVNYTLNGPIEFDGGSSGFFVNNMPVTDMEGNKAFVNASVFHENYADWNCDINLNMEEDYTRINPLTRQPMLLDRFMVLNTAYKEGDVFYGRGYATGTVNIFVTDANTEITVNARSAANTEINLPMYGNSEIEQSDYIIFDTLIKPPGAELTDYTGLKLDLNFIVTPDAQIKLIFNERTNDEIVAFGRSDDLHIELDEQNDLTMSGKFEIFSGGRSDKKSVYNFAYGPIKQPFAIKEGGSIQWTGDPYNALLNLSAYKKVNANLSAIITDVIEGNNNTNQEVYCNMIITQTLLDPLISLDIEAPKASESGKAILASVKQNKDELQKQFFSLLLFNKFVPIGGQTTGGSGGLADVLATQLNTILNGLSSEDLKLNVNYDDDQLSGQKTYALGGQYALGQKGNFILKGTFGVANTTGAQSQAQTSLVGDMSLEYLINQDGSFRVNIFNESNDNSVIQDKTNGLFTQGVGIHYQKSFNRWRELNLFNKEDRLKSRKNQREVKVNDPDPGRHQPVNNGETNEPAPPKEGNLPSSGGVKEEE